MKILSKYKDYYDYLSGIYGEDPKLILDRRDYEFNPYRFKDFEKPDFITLYIAGYHIEGLYWNYKFYYGDALEKLCKEQTSIKKSKYWWNWSNKYYEGKYHHFKWGIYTKRILGEIVKDKLEINKREDCPILIRSDIGSRTDNIQVERWPILANMNLGSYIPAEDIYQWLVDWLSQRENKKEEERGITITDIDKIKSKGFDKKRSFRPKMK